MELRMPVIDKVETAMKLRRFCANRGISQSRLARIMGVNKWTVNKWLTGERLPSIEYLLMFAKLFHSSVDRLLIYEDEN